MKSDHEPRVSDRRARRDAARAAAVARMFEHSDKLAARSLPDIRFRQRVRALAESEWHEPVAVIYLKEVKPECDVPGRRKDGTVKGKRLIRRFFWNILRGVINGVASIVTLVGAGGVANLFGRDGLVTGPENAQALALIDAARPARCPWLVYSPSHVAVIDSGPDYEDPVDGPPPKILWHAAKPHAPQVSATGERLTWPDGSVFEHVIDSGEKYFRKQNAQGGEDVGAG